MYNSLFYIKKIEAYEEASDMITWTSHITSSASILLGGPFSLVVLGLGIGTADVVIQSKIFQYSHLFDANFVNSIYIYKFDIGGLSKVYFGTMDWVNNSIISDSAQMSSFEDANSIGNAAYTSSLQTTNEISLNTPDVLVTGDLFGYSNGYLNITSNNPNSQNISGIILIRNSDTQNSISQIINLSSVEIQPYETKSIEFNYSGILLPGMPRNYISQAYVSVDGSMLDPLTSMFNVRNHNSTNRINLMNGTLIEKEEQSTIFTLEDNSESMIILSNEYGGDIDLHLNDPNGRHVGLNYTTGSIDYEIPGVTYSGPGIYPEWMIVRNDNRTDYSISTFAMMAPESVNFSVDILTLKALDTMIVSPRKINLSIFAGNTSDIIINVENLGLSASEIKNISLDGDVKDIVSYILYPKSIAGGSVDVILIKAEPKIDLNKIYTGSLFIHTTFQEMSVDLSISVISTDSEMPGSVSNLLANPGLTWINWTWTNPTDPDFNHTEIYLDDVFWTIISAEHFNATDLAPETSYTISTRTVDTAGNINQTYVNDTATTLPASDTNPPIITITSPVSGTTYSTDSVNLNYSVNEPTTWQGYSLDGAANITLHGNTTLTGFADGLHILTVYANDTSGNMNSSTVCFTIATTTPAVNTVTLNTTTPNTGDPILVTVNATDDVAVISVAANDVVLSHQSGDLWTGTITAIAGIHYVNVSATDAAGKVGWNNSTSYTATTPDTTPPAAITNLHPALAPTYINWTWTNPPNTDFNHTEIYLNGVFRTITSAEYFNATDLTPETIYTISTRTVDTAGNINQTWMNDTATTLPASDTTPPIITVHSPVNDTTYPKGSLNLNYSINEPTDWEGYSLDGAANITLYGNTTLTVLIGGLHTLTVYANDTSGNMNSSTVWFTIDTTPPSVTNSTATPPSIVADGVKISQLNVTVRDPGGIDTVTINLSAIGGSSETAMALIAEDIYSVVTSASVGTPVGVYKLRINATNINGNSNTGEYVQLVVAPVIALKKGWNLISVPLNLTIRELGQESVVGDPLNVTPENSLSSIYMYNTTSELFEKCTHYEDWGWEHATGSESFTELEPGRGYWVWAENDCDLTFTGTAPSDLDVPLDAGWNCIGWYSISEAQLGNESVVGDPLNVTPENSLTSIYRYNTTSGLFEKCSHYADWGWEYATGSESFTELEPGRGYWAWADGDCVWGHET